MKSSSRVLQIQIILLVVILLTALRSDAVFAQSSISVAITSPKNGATLHDVVTVTAMASASNGRIYSVDVFFVQGGIIPNDIPPGPKLQAPYSWNWNTSGVDNGTYQLYAQAFDDQGMNATSTPITVQIQNGAATSAPTLTPGSGVLLVIILAVAAVGVIILYRKRSHRNLNLPTASATQASSR